MIGWLSGTVREIDPAGWALLDIGGVGYDVCVSMQTLCELKPGEATALHIHTHVREDQITLYGFASPGERRIFRQLINVSGVGARMAINLLSGMPPAELLAAIDRSDATAIARTPGIGKKTAQRLILELRGRLAEGGEEAPGAAPSARDDVRSALLNLGYKPPQVDRALKGLDSSDDFETMLRSALKLLA